MASQDAGSMYTGVRGAQGCVTGTSSTPVPGSCKRLTEDYPSGDSDSHANPPPEHQTFRGSGGLSRPSGYLPPRQRSLDSPSQPHHHPYPAPPPPLTREVSLDSAHSSSPIPEQRYQHHSRANPAYPSAKHLHGEQQHLLARGNPSTPPLTSCWKHGVEVLGMAASDYPLKRQRSSRSTHSTASRRRQHEDGCTTCLRGTLHCYNVCILIIGCAALGVGVWLLVTDFGARNVTPIVDNQLYEVTTYLLIAGGGAVALLAFCGCCGTIREDKCVLSFYGTTLAIVLILLGVACGLAFFFRGMISEHVRERMKNTLAMHYGVDVRTSAENRRITDAWDAMQRQLECCGIAGNTTSDESWVYYSTATEWNKRETQKTERRFVPESCCAKGDLHLCTGLKSFDGPPIFFKSHLKKYQEINPYLYTTGCYEKLIEYVHTYSSVVGCVAAIVPLFLVLGIIISFCLCSRVASLSLEEGVEL